MLLLGFHVPSPCCFLFVFQRSLPSTRNDADLSLGPGVQDDIKGQLEKMLQRTSKESPKGFKKADGIAGLANLLSPGKTETTTAEPSPVSKIQRAGKKVP